MGFKGLDELLVYEGPRNHLFKFLPFYHYINDNPNFYWDLIIIEGRDPESFVAYPTYIPTKNKDSKHLCLHWLSADNDDTITRIKKFNFDVRTAEDKQTTSWYKEYVLSDLH